MANPVQDLAVDPQGHLYVVSQGKDSDQSSDDEDVYEWTGSWTRLHGNTVYAYAIAIDAQGNVYTANNLGHLKIRPGGVGDFVDMDAYQEFTNDLANWTFYVDDLAVDRFGQVYGAVFGNQWTAPNNNTVKSALSMWAPASLYRHPAGAGNWTRLSYPTTLNMWDKPVVVTADSSSNLYAVWDSAGTRVYILLRHRLQYLVSESHASQYAHPATPRLGKWALCARAAFQRCLGFYQLQCCQQHLDDASATLNRSKWGSTDQPVYRMGQCESHLLAAQRCNQSFYAILAQRSHLGNAP